MFRLIPGFIAIAFFLCWTPLFGLAQGQEDAIASAMHRGSSEEISNYLDARVEISFDNVKRDFSKNQAEIVLRDFFKNQPSKGFDLQQVGQTSAHVSYLIGTYRSSRGHYQVLIRRKKSKDHSFLIYSMDFTPAVN